MSMELSEFYEVFFEECNEGLDAMESGLLNLDPGTANVEEINTIFRAAHSIKGGAATFDFNEIASFTHVMETLLDEMRSLKREVTVEAVDLLLTSVDCLHEMIDATQSGQAINEPRVQDLQTQLETMLASSADGDGGEEDKPTEGASEASSAEDATNHWKIHFQPKLEFFTTGNDPYRILRDLYDLGDVNVESDLSRLPSFKDLDPDASYLAWTIDVKGNVSLEQLHQVFEWVMNTDCELKFELVSGEDSSTESPTAGASGNDQPKAEQKVVESPADQASKSEEKGAEPAPKAEAAKAPAKKVAAKTKPNEGKGGKPNGAKESAGSIRVSIEKVDVLINLVGELVITQSMLSQFGETAGEADLEHLRDGLAQLTRNTRELQETAMQIRMLPISTSFNRFPRLVRDISSKLGKKVDLRITGEATEMDKTVLEKIGDPLVHLVRNSMDHGLETPEIRRQNGKSETGVLELNAYHEGGNIVIEVVDDGAGLNEEKIHQIAIERGVVSENEELSPEDIHDLIFQPGFSTAEAVSDLSGRGVGMDVVRRNITDLGGHVYVTSERGKGSKFTIRLPLTLAILDGQLVRVGKETYIVQLVSIVESLQVAPNCINRVNGQAELYKLREEYIPIVRLHELFGVEPDTKDLEKGLLVVVEADRKRIGLFVDDLMGQQQVVIKSLETNFKQIEGLSGATILGDGTVALILDVAGIVRGDVVPLNGLLKQAMAHQVAMQAAAAAAAA